MILFQDLDTMAKVIRASRLRINSLLVHLINMQEQTHLNVQILEIRIFAVELSCNLSCQTMKSRMFA